MCTGIFARRAGEGSFLRWEKVVEKIWKKNQGFFVCFFLNHIWRDLQCENLGMSQFCQIYRKCFAHRCSRCIFEIFLENPHYAVVRFHTRCSHLAGSCRRAHFWWFSGQNNNNSFTDLGGSYPVGLDFVFVLFRLLRVRKSRLDDFQIEDLEVPSKDLLSVSMLQICEKMNFFFFAL